MRIAVVGGGKMGEAILAGWLSAGAAAPMHIRPEDVVVAEPNAKTRDRLAGAHGVACVADASGIDHADLVLLAVKPQVMPQVLPMVSAMPWARAALFVSIAAGMGTSLLESQLPHGARLVRVMPNMPLQLGCGATVLCGGANAREDDVELVRGLFGCIGWAYVIEERLMDAAGAINGCGPAYAALLVEAMARAGAAAGLDRDLAEALAAQTMLGTGKLMAEHGKPAEQTRIDVCSPGGTTIAALDAMGEAGFSEAVSAGVRAAIDRSKELGA